MLASIGNDICLFMSFNPFLTDILFFSLLWPNYIIAHFGQNVHQYFELLGRAANGAVLLDTQLDEAELLGGRSPLGIAKAVAVALCAMLAEAACEPFGTRLAGAAPLAHAGLILATN